MNALTQTKVLAEDKLFATLDSTVRRHQLCNHDILLSDTVGFIRKLPHNLIESFKSTLDEVREADILVHVVDGSSNMVHEYIDVVDTTLKDIEATNKRTILALNKVDRMDHEQIVMLKDQYPDAIFISAERGIGLSELELKIEELIEDEYLSLSISIPISKYKAIAFIHENANVTSEKYVGDKVELFYRIAKKNLKQLSHILDTIGYEGEVM